MSMKFKGSMPKYVTVMEVGRPQKAPVGWETFKVPGRPGVLLMDKTIEPFSIPITFLIEGAEREEYLRNVEDFTTWIDCEKEEELIFDDDDNRIYFAVTQGETRPSDELNIFSVVTIDFFIPDGRKYAREKTSVFSNGVANIFNKGTEPLKPVIYALAKSDVTHMDVLSDGRYLRIGQPPGFGQVALKEKEIVLNDPMNNLTGWTSSGVQTDNGDNNGTFGVAGGEFFVSSWGTGNRYNGPTMKKGVPQSPLTDFAIEFHFTFPTIAGTLGRVELYMLNDQGVAIGKLAMKKTGADVGNTVEVRLGGGAVYTFPVVFGGGSRGTEWNNFHGFIRLEKRANVYEIYIAKTIPGNESRHQYPHSVTYVDEGNLYGGNLSQVQVHIAKPGAFSPVDARIRDVKVWKINPIPDKDPAIIAQFGDYIEVDFPNSAIYINGEERRELKDLFSTFFKLPVGNTSIAIDPYEKFDAVAVVREVFK